MVTIVLLNLNGMHFSACDDLVRTVIERQIHEGERVFLKVQIRLGKLGVRSRASPDVHCYLLCLYLFKTRWSDCDRFGCDTSYKLSLKTLIKLFLNIVVELVELQMGKRHV